MTLIGMLHHRKDPGTVIKSYAYAIVAKAEGADFVYFSPNCVNFITKRIKGYVYEKGAWEERTVPFPDVIYNAGSPEKLAKAKSVIQKLKETIPFTTHSIGNKWNVAERLKEGKEFASYLIPTKTIKSSNDILHFMNAFRDVIVKPIDGRKGQGIYFIQMDGSEYVVNKDSTDIQYSRAQLASFFDPLLKLNTFIIQPYICSKTKAGLAYDFRLHVQKDGDGKWGITTIYPRVAPEGTIVTNINNGGYTNYLDPFLKQEFSKEEAFNIKRKLEHFSLSLARHLDDLQMREYQEVIDEIGVDVGLDQDQKIWIYEVNWRPGCPPAFYLEMDVVKNTIHYAIYLAKNQDKIKKKIQEKKKKELNINKIPIVAITGSAGKTTTKAFVSSIFKTRMNIFESKDYWNTTEHTKKHADEIDSTHEAIVLEYGMAYPGVITEHCGIIQPNMSIVTNIGMAHIGNFDGDIRGIAHAKSELIHGMKQDGVLFLNADDENSGYLETEKFQGKIITTGIRKTADYRAYDVAYAESGMTFKLVLHNDEHQFFIPIFGEHHVYNALNAIAIADYLGFSPLEIKSGLLFRKPPRRMTIYQLKESMTMIDDTVHSHPQAVIAAIDVLKNIAKGRKIAILGQMRELGDLRDEQYKKVGEYLAEQSIDLIITYGYRADAIGAGAIGASFPEESVKHFLDKDKMHEYLQEILQEKDTILIKGASKTNMFDTVAFLDTTYALK
ncbi:YheC/YheD family protein [Domibacillus sp. A3M-37]|uniref:YheC/YheD family protein n=1 Tax=Domibacillus TaxID=1433999 RepID=UPI0020B67AAA|nr:YheC/YheD family protein [Domibacillus sp. A3M-37]MCP3762290.1 YheC/YheD family protein [Domibacillus sp. A3M-37]